MMLAESSIDVGVTPAQFGIWVLCFLVFVTLVVSVAQLVKAFRNDSEKREVTINPEVLTRREFEEARRVRDEEFKSLVQTLKEHIKLNHDEHEGIHSKIGGEGRGIRAEMREEFGKEAASRKSLHEQNNQILVALGRVQGKLEKL